MSYPYYLLDVFTEQMFGGNPLAVFPQARGLSSEQMQKIAAEFNLSETVFIFPSTNPQACRRLRIFTPKAELPFAGHPTLGSAYLLGAIGEIPLPESENRFYLEEEVGLIPITLHAAQGKPIFSELRVSQTPEFREEIPPRERLAAMLSLEPEELILPNYGPAAVSCGLPFLLIPVRNPTSLARAKLQPQLWESLLASSWASCVYLFTPLSGEIDWRVRMFAPSLGIAEDPATGSGAAAFGAYLGKNSPANYCSWVLEQGIEMGRPSSLRVSLDREGIRVGGAAILVGEGVLYI
jgi:trans-2,3-dihydro-3-hydroxyanthranilate isomerase